MSWYPDETGQKRCEISPIFSSSTVATPSPVPEVVLHFSRASGMAGSRRPSLRCLVSVWGELRGTVLRVKVEVFPLMEILSQFERQMEM